MIAQGDLVEVRDFNGHSMIDIAVLTIKFRNS